MAGEHRAAGGRQAVLEAEGAERLFQWVFSGHE